MQSLILLDFRTVALCAALIATSEVVLAQDAQRRPGSTHMTVTCASQAGERRVYAADTSAGVTLVKSTGAAACLLGKTWGYDFTGVWVMNGCGGEFVVGQTATTPTTTPESSEIPSELLSHERPQSPVVQLTFNF